MKNLKQEALDIHRYHQGKLEVSAKLNVKDIKDLSLVYSPGVAEPCREIHEDSEKVYDFTMKANTVAVVTDGTAVLGLGDIGADASLPVMEGKAILFKNFAGVDAFPICIGSNDIEEIIKTVKLLKTGFGGVNLEDIKAPNCFIIEERLKKELDIPVFHDDQHGTAIVTLAGLINALKLTKKSFENLRIVINGAGAAGMAIAKLLLSFNVQEIIMCDSKGAIYKGRSEGMNPVKDQIAEMTNHGRISGTLTDVIEGTDVFIGVSVAGALTEEMIKKMNHDPIIFAMANPDPEILPLEAKAAGAKIVGTGRSDYPNQVNNVLAFPGIFRGALDTKSTDINEEMKVAAAYAIASLISEYELHEDYIIPSPFDARVAPEVAAAVAKAAMDSGVARKHIDIESLKNKTYQLSAIQVKPVELIM
ncbi:malate dehydrogenase (oxaloacetate-decarboxylating) [Oikeobacillus pervagus]|uniref:Malate dehydrogenase (Oxaloacetate-decarboxylating) n=1 Tax=Oikeobacillus pervagus TaxID=1325931 RepID=A0AAJ1T2S5_9BACI|nr:malic enzyme-like NAD(P)-binding protein [Oikeobacillus pervagus]MDQ0214869.1 malate dehydrogenase (oxaloacetate-decarboxylating) [Oikeobacillus pervagus]